MNRESSGCVRQGQQGNRRGTANQGGMTSPRGQPIIGSFGGLSFKEVSLASVHRTSLLLSVLLR